MPIAITPGHQVSDNATLQLGGATATTSVVIGGVTYVFVAGSNDSGISVFSLAADGMLTPILDLGDDASLMLGGVSTLTTASIGGATYLYAAGLTDSGISVFQVNVGGSLTPIQNVMDDGSTLLASPHDLTIATIGARSFLYAPSATENGISVFEIGSDGALTFAFNIADSDNAAHLLHGVKGVSSATVDDVSYLLAMGAEGTSVFQIAADGALTQTWAMDYASTGFIPSDAAVVTVGPKTFFAITMSSYQAVRMYQLYNDGTLGQADYWNDQPEWNFGGALSVVSMTLGVRQYIAVSGTEAGATLFEVNADGAMIYAGNFNSATLTGAVDLGFAVVGGKAFLLATGEGSNSVETVLLTPNNETPTSNGDNRIDHLEGALVAVTADDLHYTDPDQVASGLVYTIQSVAHGVIMLNGVALANGGTFTQADVDGGLVAYQHDGSEPTGSFDRLTYTITDGQGYSRANRSLNFLADYVNDAPMVDLNGATAGVDASAAWIAGNAPVALTPSAQLTDIDNGYFLGGALTVAITDNFGTGDMLSIIASSDIALVGNEIYFGGTSLIGTFAGGTGGNPLIVTFRSDGADPVYVQALMRAIGFSNGAGMPSEAQRAITFSVTDGNNGDAATGSAVVHLDVSVPDGPADEDFTVTLHEDADDNFVTLTVYDDDATHAPTFTLSTLPQNGRLLTSGGFYIQQDVAYTADHYDADLGAWVLTLNFRTDTNWRGQTSFHYSATTFTGETTNGATGTLNVLPVADLPYMDDGLHYAPRLTGSVSNVSNSSSTADDSPLAVTLSNGNTLLVWQAGPAASANIKGRYFDPSGNALGAAFNITATGGNPELQPSVAAGTNGTFAVTYVSNPSGSGGGNAVTSFFTNGATTATSTVNTAASSTIREADPTVTSLGTGFVVTWAVQAGTTATIRAQRYTDAGVASGAAFDVVTSADRGTGTGTSFDPPDHQIADLGGGNFVIVSKQGDYVQARVIHADNQIDNLGNVNGGGAVADQPTVTKLAGGGFVVAWRQVDNGSTDQNIYGRVYDANGVPGTVTPLATTPANETLPSVAALPDGRFVLVWLTNGGVNNTRDVMVNSFNADGTPFGTFERNVSYTGGSSNETQANVSVDANGLISVSWLVGNTAEVMLQHLTPGATRLSGDAGQTITLDATTATYDPNEKITQIFFDGIPPGFSFQAGARDGATPNRWVIDRSTAEEAAFIDAFVNYGTRLELTTPRGFSGDFTMTMTAFSAENSDGNNFAFNSVQLPVHINAVPNQAPVLDLDPDNPGTGSVINWTEDQGPQELAYYATLTDDNASYAGATITATITGNGSFEDTLRIRSEGDGLGQLRVSDGNVFYEGALIANYAGGTSLNPLVVTFTSAATRDGVQKVIGGIRFNNQSDTPDTALRTVTLTLVDGEGTANGGHDTVTATTKIHVYTHDDQAFVNNDTAQVTENSSTVIAIFDNDFDPDSGMEVLLVGNQLIDVNGTITLASGARVTLNANGTLTYNTNNAFNYLVTAATAAATGASNSVAVDSFTYILADGATATVSVTVSGLTSAGDRLMGTAGADTITGTSAPDIIDGLGGVDRMVGGLGDDLYYVDSSGDVVIELANQGNDVVFASASYALVGYIENLVLTGNAAINGTGNSLANMLVGNSAANVMSGGDGNDTIDGGGGADTMYGGAGNDIFFVSDVGDIAIEYANQGTDLVQASITYSLTGQYIENLTLVGGAAINGTGNSLNNLITGNSAANSLWGMEGNDTIDGGGGVDTLYGGLGDDTYSVDQVGDLAVELANEGTDTVRASITYSLGGQYVENLTLTGTAAINGTGNKFNNILIGNSAANTLNGGEGNDSLDGGAGADTLIGGVGDDTYYVDNVGDMVIEAANSGTDTVYATITYVLQPNQYIENLRLLGTGAINGTGNSLSNIIFGTSGVNTLWGLDGHDWLYGEGGADTLIGGKGDDTYVVSDAATTVIELNGEGNDTVLSSVIFSLAGIFVENLTLTGINAINATGNKLANTLVGNVAANTLDGGEGNDVLDGGGGADIMIGGLGDDIYYVGQIGDIAIEKNGEGFDQVASTVSYSLAGQFIEVLVLDGNDAIDGTGNKLDNWLYGNDAANVLNGGEGNDTIEGGLGADTLTGGLGSDAFRFYSALGGGNVDSITDFNVAADTLYLGGAIFAGTGPDGVLAAGAFVNGAAALDADDRILYDSATGNIYYDADGSGAGAAVQFAKVTAGTALTNADFVIEGAAGMSGISSFGAFMVPAIDLLKGEQNEGLGVTVDTMILDGGTHGFIPAVEAVPLHVGLMIADKGWADSHIL